MNVRNPFAVGGSHPGGMISGATPGRADRVPMRVRNGSFVIPSDIPAALGEGNSESGAEILSRMFKTGPYGSGATGQLPRSGARPAQFANMMRRRGLGHADGGDVEQSDDGDIPIRASHGEFILPPETVAEVGHGNLRAGQRVLEKFVLRVRREHIAKLRKFSKIMMTINETSSGIIGALFRGAHLPVLPMGALSSIMMNGALRE